MLIQVRWANRHYDYVKDFMLDNLIESGAVANFLRSSGWVKIGVDPIRASKEQVNYAGAERRAENRLRPQANEVIHGPLQVH